MAFKTDLKYFFSPQQADFLGDDSATLAAAGTTQGAATALSSSINLVTTATGGVNDAVRLPAAASYKQTRMLIRNDSGATIQIFPASGENIHPNGLNAAVTLATATGLLLFKINTSQWTTA